MKTIAFLFLLWSNSDTATLERFDSMEQCRAAEKQLLESLNKKAGWSILGEIFRQHECVKVEIPA